jgi:hypothetical protein
MPSWRMAGLVRSQMAPLIAGCAGSRELLDQMLARLGIDAAQLPIESQRKMTWACTTCPDKRLCRAWLAGTDHTHFYTFCPNAAELEYALSSSTRPSPDAAAGDQPPRKSFIHFV